MNLRDLLRDERGVALPLALMGVVILAVLTAAFAAMSVSEPRIAVNHAQGTQALALAEAGMEWAIDALNNWAVNGGPDPLAQPQPITNPYGLPNSSENQYQMTIAIPAGGGHGNPRQVTSTGSVFVPGNAQARAIRRVTAVLTQFPILDPPCAVCVKGDLGVQGNSSIDARSSTCGPKEGARTTGDLTTQGSGEIYGDSDDVKNELGQDYVEFQPSTSFDPFTLTAKELNILRTLAQTQGTYIKPNPGEQISFGSGNELKKGLVFVDTDNGVFNPSAPDPTHFADVKITGADTSGWLIVLGKLAIDGNVKYSGLVYVVDDISYKGTGTGGINGALISLNSAEVTGPDSTTLGQAKIKYDCQAIKDGGNTIPKGYTISPGNWEEINPRA